jgi:protein tyrosine/serine phosphatase
MKNPLSLYSIVFTAIVCLAAFSAFSQTAPGGFPGIKIENFGQMDPHYYRGAQPQKKDYQDLKQLGVKTIIDLQEKPTGYEKPAAEALGMKYINIPMDSGEYPPQAAIDRFLKEINDPANGVVFVHCKGGKHRTGVTGAVYRLTKDGWDYDKAMKEMENYHFFSGHGHEAMKDFVVDYAAKTKRLPKTSAH